MRRVRPMPSPTARPTVSGFSDDGMILDAGERGGGGSGLGLGDGEVAGMKAEPSGNSENRPIPGFVMQWCSVRDAWPLPILVRRIGRARRSMDRSFLSSNVSQNTCSINCLKRDVRLSLTRALSSGLSLKNLWRLEKISGLLFSAHSATT